MSNDLGFGVPMSRRNLTALRSALEALEPGTVVVARFRVTGHGQFTVTGPVWRDLTETVLKVGWWDLTNGKKAEPVAELQSLTTAAEDDASVPDHDDLGPFVAGLEAGDIVAAQSDVEGCGAFAISGGVRRDEHGTRWVLAGHHLTLGDSPAPRRRCLAVEHRADSLVTAAGSHDLFAG
ncbi:hypothetical protein ACFP63_14560 [Oerskovia jenensis]|uniref:Uncharacterized protein n=1 Tax=Oerskovia jenensis TaxID=162169 RepID=A0ABS2L9T2_9CELL|nr:hypothetical protein [Oerskovia jenensis]MBM7477155.1 hypothetical protein [Oerskovia jenensis]